MDSSEPCEVHALACVIRLAAKPSAFALDKIGVGLCHYHRIVHSPVGSSGSWLSGARSERSVKDASGTTSYGPSPIDRALRRTPARCPLSRGDWSPVPPAGCDTTPWLVVSMKRLPSTGSAETALAEGNGMSKTNGNLLDGVSPSSTRSPSESLKA